MIHSFKRLSQAIYFIVQQFHLKQMSVFAEALEIPTSKPSTKG